MSDEVDTAPRATAGALLRAARERQGLHIAALAAAIKVAPRKLDALEHDRYDELPDATFTRALAQTVCRSLKIDPQPVLALLPAAEPSALDHVSMALNTPFRERPGRSDPGGFAAAAVRPLVLVALLLLAAAAAVFFVPANVWENALSSAPAVVAVAPATSPASVPTTVAPDAAPSPAAAASMPPAFGAPTTPAAGEPVFVPPPESGASAPAVAPSASPIMPPAPVAAPAPTAAVSPAPAPATASVKSLVQLVADEASWIEVRDGRGQVLLSRTVLKGESVGFDGPLPIRMTIGNAPATRVSLRGKPVDLAASTRDSVARIELQ